MLIYGDETGMFENEFTLRKFVVKKQLHFTSGSQHHPYSLETGSKFSMHAKLGRDENQKFNVYDSFGKVPITPDENLRARYYLSVLMFTFKIMRSTSGKFKAY